jgi:hypothetical protein
MSNSHSNSVISHQNSCKLCNSCLYLTIQIQFVIWFVRRFRLRHHYVTKHPGLPVKWRDLTNGQLCDQSTKLTPSIPSSSPPAARSPVCESAQVPAAASKSTARKSTTRSGLRVAMFRCGQFFSIRRLEPSPQDSASDLGDVLREGGDDDDDDSRSSAPTQFCCHICAYKTDDVNRFWRHLRADHFQGTGSSGATSGDFPAVRVLVVDADDDPGSGIPSPQNADCARLSPAIEIVSPAT